MSMQELKYAGWNGYGKVDDAYVPENTQVLRVFLLSTVLFFNIVLLLFSW